MKRIYSIIQCLFLAGTLLAQGNQNRSKNGNDSKEVLVNEIKTLNLIDCYDLAKQNFPLIKEKELIKKTREFTVENASKGHWPQITFTGQATYQSEVTSLPIKLPGVTVPSLNKDQYRVVGEVTQTLYDGGMVNQQKKMQEASADVQDQNLEVQLYSLKDRINQLFFGTLLVDEQLKQNELLQKNIKNNIEKLQAGMDNGTVMKSNVLEMEAELITREQSRIEIRSGRKAFLDMLSLFINGKLGESTGLLKPPGTNEMSDSIKRPELAMFLVQKKNYDIQDEILNANKRPKVQLFFQEGFGRPSLNMLDNSFNFYSIGGIRFNWTLSGLYTLQNDRQLLAVNRQNTDVQQELFLFNTKMALRQQGNDIQKYREMISKDNEIIQRRTEVRIAANAQLENGTISSHEYLGQLIAEDQARQNLILHQMQLLMKQYDYQNTLGTNN